MANTEMIDLCSGWIEARGANYLCKENCIVYYSSLTGRSSDYTWHSLSLSEAIRIIRATLLTPDQYDQLTQNELIASCQELARVYEFGTKSRFNTVPEVFNYLKESGTSTAEAVMELLAEECYSKGRGALFIEDLTDVFNRIIKSLKEPEVKAVERNQLINKHFSKLGYSIRVDSLRVKIKSKWHRAVMLAGQKPSDLINITGDESKHLVAAISGALK